MVMTRKDKELLLRDLCCRLPYNVKGCFIDECGAIPNDPYSRNISLTYTMLVAVDGRDGRVLRGEIKPYLLPLSSMTEAQKEEFEGFVTYHPYVEGGWVMVKVDDGIYIPCELVDWCLENHFDYRGLISKGLAIDATGLGIY